MTRGAARASHQTLGRDALVADLVGRVFEGQTVVIHGPPGIGKSAVLEELRARAEGRSLPCGLSARTLHLCDITHALASAYPNVLTSASQRIVRARLRDAAFDRPGVLLLDHFTARGAPVKGSLRSLRGTRLGILIAADTNGARDHAALRAQCLTSTEIQVMPLALRHLRTLWHDMGVSRRISLSPANEELVLRLAQGRPGYLIAMAEQLEQSSRLGGQPSLCAAHADVIARLALGHPALFETGAA